METFCVRAASRQAASQFLNPVSINLKKLPQMPASEFLNHSGRNWPNPGCSFYLPVSMCRTDPVKESSQGQSARAGALRVLALIKAQSAAWAHHMPAPRNNCVGRVVNFRGVTSRCLCKSFCASVLSKQGEHQIITEHLVQPQHHRKGFDMICGNVLTK